MNSFLGPLLSGMVGFALLLCVFFIILGGFGYITSSGDATKLIKSKSTIIRALIGLAIVIAASAIALILKHAYGANNVSSISQLPKINAIKPNKTSDGLIAVLIKSISGIFEVIIKSAAQPFIDALAYFTKQTPLLVHNSAVVKLWVICTGLADSLLALAVALIGFHVMSAEQLGVKDFNLRTILPELLLVFIVMNSSIYILDGIIELSNALIAGLRSAMGNITPWHSLINLVSNISGYSLPSLLILVIFIVFTVILLIYYLGRLVVLYLGAVLSPLIVLMWLLPSLRDFAENSFKTYVSTIFVLFIHVIILSLAASLFLEVSSPAASNSGGPIMGLLLGLATLITLIKTQGVLMQLNYASLGPRTARNLASSFINGVGYMVISSKESFAAAAASYRQDSVSDWRTKVYESKPAIAIPKIINHFKNDKE